MLLFIFTWLLIKVGFLFKKACKVSKLKTLCYEPSTDEEKVIVKPELPFEIKSRNGGPCLFLELVVPFFKCTHHY